MKGQMIYLEGDTMFSGSPGPVNTGARKYTGAVASGYDAKREDAPKWKAEQKAVADLLSTFPAGARVIDVPVGTGRFVSLYEEMKLKWRGFDISEDMLIETKRKVMIPELCECLEIAPVQTLPLADKSIDVAVMCRLTRWLTPGQRTAAIAELKRVARDAIIFTARVDNHQYAYPYADIKRDLGDDWVIESDISADGPNYCVLKAVPCSS